ncbi:MAG TPA: hypothetical protein VFN37_07265 [Candidatus Baltobacteraceae bacterium]|nr:hypothetical protein [Candidatus Baltobacteraceae bacterium]
MTLRSITLALAACLACASPAFAWEHKGHEIVNNLAAKHLPSSLPAFARTAQAAYEITYLGPELDRLKGSGKSWDADYDPGHFIDLQDDGTVAGVVPFNNLPASAAAYDRALRAADTDQYAQGYLPYSILDGWEQLREDFAYWRVDKGAARAIDQQLILRDIGIWGHYVADACQPLHVTVHYNGWGKYPNPNGYTESTKTHAFFEGAFVNRYVSEAQAAALMPRSMTLPAPAHLLSQRTVLHEVERYLLQTGHTVPQLYQIEKAGGFRTGSPQAVRFVASRLAAGATELRDLTAWAWDDSLNESVGYPAERVRDILAGKARWPAGANQ